MKLSPTLNISPKSALQRAVTTLGFLIIILSAQQIVIGQDAAVDMQALSLREQELLRKERELLQAMGLATEVEVTHSDDTGSSEILPTSGEHVGLLDTIKSHPALKPPSPKTAEFGEHVPTDKFDAPPHRGQVRTHYSQDYHDGTTAGRINRFFKLEPADTRIDPPHQPVRVSPLSEEAELEQRARIKDPQRLVATIRGGSATIKMGPGPRHARILRLSREAPVEIDYRKGSWYRIKTSAGVRGWVEGGDLLFNDGIKPTSLIHIGGISSHSVN